MTRIWRVADKRAKLHRAQSGRCYYCEAGVSLRRSTLDHKIPRSRGGPGEPWNLVVACRSCNSDKGQLTEAEYRAWIKDRSQPRPIVETEKHYMAMAWAGMPSWLIAGSAPSKLASPKEDTPDAT